VAHRSKWGWHPCDYNTYRLLKALNRLCEKARRQHAAWDRWQRKLPHNRVIRRAVLDEAGNKVGAEVAGPRPEPPVGLVFCLRKQVLTRWSEDGRPLKTGRMVDTVAFDDHGVPDAYRTARHPKASEEEVEGLRLKVEDVHRLARLAGLVD
jgi:hypothetical protein